MRSLKNFVAAAAVTLAALPAAAQACSTCGCGDYSITLMGIEKPFAGRLRTSMDYAARSESFGVDAGHHELDEGRATLGLSWSPVADATVALQVPYVSKRLVEDGVTTDTHGFGDADLTARVVLYQDGRTVPHHLGGLRVGLRLPTSERAYADDGTLIDIDAQPDAGALARSLGAWYGYYDLPVLVSFSVAHLFYGHGRQEFDPGDATLASLTGQYGFGDFAVQVGLDARHAQRNVRAGVVDPDSGGTLLMASPGVAYRFGSDFVVNAGAQLPVVKRLNGAQDETAGWRAGVAYDF